MDHYKKTEKKVDVCENRWLRLILRINYKDKTQIKKSENTKNTNKQQDKTNAIKVAVAYTTHD